MAKDAREHKYEIPLDGKLITGEDPAKIGPNFQTLTNMRYGLQSPYAIGGMSKITASQINATYFKARSGIHFTKSQPEESHVLAQAYNTGLTASKIYRNDTAIPSAGAFTATELYTPNTSGDHGRWSIAPDGDVAYCNGAESCIWGGDEREIAGFINYDPGGSFSYDLTEQMRNRRTDSDSIATLNTAPGGIDADVMMLLHLNDNVTDSSPTTAHTVTKTNGSYDASVKKFGSHALTLSTNAYLSIPDNADFSFADGTFTIDTWVRVTSLADYSVLYYQNTDADNYLLVYIDIDGSVKVSLYATAAETLNGTSGLSTDIGLISVNTWYHIEVSENGNAWQIFVDGEMKAFVSDASRCANYTQPVIIGYDGATYAEMKLDEYRVSSICRHTENFTVPTAEYTSSSAACYNYIGAVRPLSGFKIYVQTANTSASSMSVDYWDGTTWTSVSSLSDGTSSGGISLAQTGSVTFTSTASVAKPKYIEGVMVYWYKITISAVNTGTTIYYATAAAPFQTIKDIWSGNPFEVDSFLFYNNDDYEDKTLNVREERFSSTDDSTFAEIDSMATSDEYLVAGFSERMFGFVVHFANGKGNRTAATTATVYYWNGTEWTSVGAIDDGTLHNGKSFAKTGAITWNKISEASEFTRSINNDVKLFYYKIKFDKTLSGDVQVYYVTGIPAPKSIQAFKFPLLSNDRLFLCNETDGDKNSVLCSAFETSTVFNGDDSTRIRFGDDGELMAGAWLYSQYGSSIYNVTLFAKKNETWALVGDSPENFVKYRISKTAGCIAPNTMKVVDLVGVPNQQQGSRNVAIWRGSAGIYMSDGRTPVDISADIKDKFDKRETTSANLSRAEQEFAFWDDDNKCYHWVFSSGTNTVHDQEWVFDFGKNAWFQVDRTTAKALQFGIEVEDLNGGMYNYGFIDSGYMERLENGNDFDGVDITCTLQFGDIAIHGGSVVVETMAQRGCLIAVSKTTTTATIAMTHYGDGETSGESWTFSTVKSGHRIIMPVEHKTLGAHIFHSWKMVIATNNEVRGFEPLYFFVLYDLTREHLRDGG